MSDPLNWSLPLGRMFGVNVRAHILLPVFMLGIYLKVVTPKDAPPGIAVDAAVVLGLLFLSILLHEFGHVFAARFAGGDSEQILMWPLGGLAYCDLPHRPRAHLICTAGGPLVNLLICVFAGLALVAQGILPPINPFTSDPYNPPLINWLDGLALTNSTWYNVLAARLFWLNWVLYWFNLVPAYPLDGGRLLQSVLWFRGDYRQATTTAVYIGFGVMLVFCMVAIFKESAMLILLVIFIYVNCRQELVQLEHGGEESPLGYDFSQGYSSLERETAARPRRPRLNFFQRWLQRRATRKAQSEIEQREAEELRMDQLLDKIAHSGKGSLTDEEHRFMRRYSEQRYRDHR